MTDHDKDPCTEVALFRYGMIVPLLDLSGAARARAMREQAARVWSIPGSRRTRVAESTIRDWIFIYRESGFEGLKPKRRQDRGKPRRLSEEAAEILIAIRKDNPGLGVPDVVSRARTGHGLTDSISLSSVYRLFHAEDLMNPPPVPRDRRRFAWEHAGELWMSDVMHGPLCGDGRRRRKTYMIVVLDDCTRVVTWSAFAFSEDAASFLAVFKQALMRRGKPVRLYVDNGSAYRSRRLAIICAKLGIALIHATPYQPAGKGKVERYIRTCRQRFLPTLTDADRTSLDSLNRCLAAWVEGEYHHTPHRGLDRMTPLDKWAACSSRVDLIGHDVDLDDLFLKEASRRVNKDRTVSLDNRLYEVAVELVGRQVTLRFDPQMPPQRPLRVAVDGRDAGLAWPLDCHANARVRRIAFRNIDGED